MTPIEANDLLTRMVDAVELWIKTEDPVPFDLVVEWAGHGVEAWAAATAANQMFAILVVVRRRGAVRVALRAMEDMASEYGWEDGIRGAWAWLRGADVEWDSDSWSIHRLYGVARGSAYNLVENGLDLGGFISEHLDLATMIRDAVAPPTTLELANAIAQLAG